MPFFVFFNMQGAINISTAADVMTHFLSEKAITVAERLRSRGKCLIPVFHCEFSLKRSVEL